MPTSKAKISGSRIPALSASTRFAKNTSAALRDSEPSLLMTNGAGDASEMNALLPHSRRYTMKPLLAKFVAGSTAVDVELLAAAPNERHSSTRRRYSIRLSAARRVYWGESSPAGVLENQVSAKFGEK